MEGGGRTSRSHVATTPAVVVVEIALVVATACAGAAVIIGSGVAPCWSWVDGLHRDLGPGLSGGVEGLSSGVILCPELYGGLHGDLGLLGKAMAAVGGRRAAITWRRGAI